MQKVADPLRRLRTSLESLYWDDTVLDLENEKGQWYYRLPETHVMHITGVKELHGEETYQLIQVKKIRG
jgi:hypothetical protein